MSGVCLRSHQKCSQSVKIFHAPKTSLDRLALNALVCPPVTLNVLHLPLMQMITYTQNDLYFVSHGSVVIRVDVGLGDNK